MGSDAVVALVWTIENAVRVSVVLLALALVGTNFAFVIHAPTIFPKGATTVWRLFFTGKTLITSSAAWTVWDRTADNKPIGLVTALVVGGVLFSNIALWMLYRFHQQQHTPLIIVTDGVKED